MQLFVSDLNHFFQSRNLYVSVLYSMSRGAAGGLCSKILGQFYTVCSLYVSSSLDQLPSLGELSLYLVENPLFLSYFLFFLNSLFLLYNLPLIPLVLLPPVLGAECFSFRSPWNDQPFGAMKFHWLMGFGAGKVLWGEGVEKRSPWRSIYDQPFSHCYLSVSGF